MFPFKSKCSNVWWVISCFTMGGNSAEYLSHYACLAKQDINIECEYLVSCNKFNALKSIGIYINQKYAPPGKSEIMT